jgi:hypothetical protein
MPNHQAGWSPTFGFPQLLFNVFTDNFHIWRPSPSSTTWGRTMLWWQGIHLTWIELIISNNNVAWPKLWEEAYVCTTVFLDSSQFHHLPDNFYNPVQKVSDLKPEKKSCVTGRAQFLIPFKVGPLWLHTLSPTFLPLLEAFLERYFWKASQLLRHIPHDVLIAVKTGSLQWPLQFGEQPEITRSHVWE